MIDATFASYTSPTSGVNVIDFILETAISIDALSELEIFTIPLLSTSSIVITAVYILRAAGIMLMGAIKNKEHELLPDAHWYDKVAVFTLIAVIAGVGFFPNWLVDIIYTDLGPMFERMMSQL